MNRTILIPTDFRIESLNLLKAALEETSSDPVTVVLFHGVNLSASISDLLFFSKQKLIESLVTQEFHDACRVIENKYGLRIHAIRIDFFYGITQSAFNNFLEGNQITEIYIPDRYKLNLTDKRSFSPMKYILRSKILIRKIAWQAQENIPEKNMLAELFYFSSNHLVKKV